MRLTCHIYTHCCRYTLTVVDIHPQVVPATVLQRNQQTRATFNSMSLQQQKCLSSLSNDVMGSLKWNKEETHYETLTDAVYPYLVFVGVVVLFLSWLPREQQEKNGRNQLFFPFSCLQVFVLQYSSRIEYIHSFIHSFTHKQEVKRKDVWSVKGKKSRKLFLTPVFFFLFFSCCWPAGSTGLPLDILNAFTNR